MPRTNLLGTRTGRLALFGLLYLGEGLPQGFIATAVALEFKRMGMSAEALGTFAATVMAPWAWKWLMGPVVDNLHSRRFGRRSQWVVAMQGGMILTLLLALTAFPAGGVGGTVPGLALFTSLLLVHNGFAACQDVAIDAMAVSVLAPEERGRANGLMFGGAQLGMALGGSGVIALKGLLGFSTAALLVPACIVLLLTLMLRFVVEPRTIHDPDVPAPGMQAVAVEVRDYLHTVFKVFFTTRRGFLGLVLALLPAGCLSLSLTLSNVISPTLGMSDDEIAALGVASSVVFALACLGGGAVSDRFGRRISLAAFAGATALPTLWMAWRLHAAGWENAPAALGDGTWPRADGLIVDWAVATVVYSGFFGMMYGVRSALYMDIAEPRIAATQFTASMALLNVVTMYSYWWEGKALTPTGEGGWGFTLPQTLLVDVGIGLLFLLVLPLVTAPAAGQVSAPVPAE